MSHCFFSFLYFYFVYVVSSSWKTTTTTGKKNTLTDVDLRMKPYNRWNAVAGHSILEVKFEIWNNFSHRFPTHHHYHPSTASSSTLIPTNQVKALWKVYGNVTSESIRSVLPSIHPIPFHLPPLTLRPVIVLAHLTVCSGRFSVS